MSNQTFDYYKIKNKNSNFKSYINKYYLLIHRTKYICITITTHPIHTSTKVCHFIKKKTRVKSDHKQCSLALTQ